MNTARDKSRPSQELAFNTIYKEAILLNGDHWAKIWEIARDIADIKSNGCAHRESDLERIDKVERSTARLHERIDTLVMLLIANLAALIISIISRVPAILKFLGGGDIQ